MEQPKDQANEHVGNPIACAINASTPSTDLRIPRNNAKFPAHNSVKDFHDLLHEWISMVNVQKNNQPTGQHLIFLNRCLNASQRVLYSFYLLDQEISNGGFLKLVINRNVHLFYFLFTKENISTIENFDLWGRVLYTAFEKSKPIYIEMLKNRRLGLDEEYETHKNEFAELDDLYLKHKDDFWNDFRLFVEANQNDFFH